MISGIYEQELIAYIIFGIFLNFAFSLSFGIYLSKNIGIQDMMSAKGEKEQSVFVRLSLLVPFAKMIITIYRVAILQFFFLDKGLSHKEFWVYMTTE